jgi:hypothetical protein
MNANTNFDTLLDFLDNADHPRADQLHAAAETLIHTITAQAGIIRALEAELRARRAGDEPLAAILANIPRPAAPVHSPISAQEALAACRELADSASRSRDTTAILEKVARLAKALLL